MELLIKDRANTLPKGFVTFELTDMITGEVLNNVRLPMKMPNQATLMAKECASRVLAGDMTYAAARIEWGRGNTTTSASDTNLNDPFAPSGQGEDVGIFTSISDVQHPALGQALFLSAITTEADTYADGNGTVFIQEVGLRTIAKPGYPKGILIARFVNDAPIPKAGTRISLSVKWLYIYA